MQNAKCGQGAQKCPLRKMGWKMEISVFYTLCLRVLRILGETAECERAECRLQTEFTITQGVG